MKNICLILLLHSFLNFAQKTDKLTVYSFEEIENLQQQNPKPLLIFVYTDWCDICFGMKKTTFQNEEISTILNTDFYVIYLNAETEKEISFLGKSYKKPSSKIHELAAILAKKNNQIVYPTTVILNKECKIETQLQGFMNSKNFKPFLDALLAKDN
ncbi:thioredoxin family protein [Polaribacter sp.]|uniref:thioredoxin family protein n=1 Tax=Polaribacter sp. TaxID=1920175 RepID=UPI0040476E54